MILYVCCGLSFVFTLCLKTVPISHACIYLGTWGIFLEFSRNFLGVRCGDGSWGADVESQPALARHAAAFQLPGQERAGHQRAAELRAGQL